MSGLKVAYRHSIGELNVAVSEKRAGIQGMDEAEREEQKAADVALLYLISEMRELGVGTLGEALDQYWRSHDARSAALRAKYPELYK